MAIQRDLDVGATVTKVSMDCNISRFAPETGDSVKEVEKGDLDPASGRTRQKFSSDSLKTVQAWISGP